MSFLVRLSALLVLLLLPGFSHGQEKPFLHRGLAGDAERYEAYLKKNWQPGSQSLERLRAEGERILAAGNDPRGASRNFARAVVGNPNDSASWTGLAQALLAIPADPKNPRERYNFATNAGGSAYLAYLRATTSRDKARALAVVAEAAQRRSMWRPALEALKASLALAENAEVRATYEKVRAEHGFRVTDYKVDSDSKQPRACIQFSELLARDQQDFSKFLSLDGKDPQSVQAEGRQLCLDGLKHGQRYQLTVRAGLPSSVGEKLEKSADLSIYVRDRSPAVRINGRSYVLPSSGQQGIPIVSVNTDKLDVSVYRIGDRGLVGMLQGEGLQRQLSEYEIDNIRQRSGSEVYSGTLEVTSRLNEDVVTAFPVSDALPKLQPGVYLLAAKPQARSGENGGSFASQWFIVSDLGLTAFSAKDGIHAFVRSLASANTISGANVRLIARNNEVLGTTKTDAHGYARFAAGLTRGEGGSAPALLAVEGVTGDYAFLDLATAGFDLTDRGVKGREAPGPVDTFLYTDRGVYRPGETIHFAALVRDANARAAKLPVTLIITRPDGVEHRRQALTDQGAGGRAADLSLSGGAMTGTWRARIHTDPKDAAIAQTAFLVEDFMPERLSLELTPKTAALTPDGANTVAIAGRYLYGPPASDLAIEGEVVVRPAAADLPDFNGYRFGLADERVSPVRANLDGLPETDKDGRAEITVKLPALPKTARPLEAQILVRLREPGGRTIERSLVQPVSTGLPRIGIKPLFKGALGVDETASFEIISLSGAGKRLPTKGLKWELSRLEQSWQWYSRDSQWQYEPVTITRRVANGVLDGDGMSPVALAQRVRWGRYRLDVTSDNADGPASSIVFTAGWWAEEGADSPEMLELALDKPVYKPGDTAKVRVVSKDAGKAVVAVVSSSLVSVHEAEIAAGGGEISVPVTEAWSPGAYVLATLYRPLDTRGKRMPGRSMGLKWVGLDPSARDLKVALEAPAKTGSGSRLTVPVKLDGARAGEDTYVTVAAVDVGILNLTRFKSPDPSEWFNGQRRLGADIRDLYGRLIDGMHAERGRLRSGGDGPAGMDMKGSPPVEETLALFSGIVKTDQNGIASVTFDLPDFNGTVRLMAVAWSDNRVGSATKDVIVRDALALVASTPRFLTLGDETRLQVDLHNVEGPAGSFDIAVETRLPSGELDKLVRRTVALEKEQRKAERIPLKPAAVGLTQYNVRVTGPNGIDVRRTLSLDVKPPAGDIKRTTVVSLAARTGKVTVDKDLVQDLISARTTVNMSVGPTARFDVPGLLTSLDRYPYGCAEQTVSRALPLVYLNDMAKRVGMATDSQIRDRIGKAIARVLEMQDSSGAFGVWRPSSGDLWLTSYVTDFLTRAREAGYAVPSRPMTMALDRLRNFISYVKDFEKGGEDRAYALYVLARNSMAPVGELRYYADDRLDRFATPLAQAQIGAALAMVGDKERAARAFRAALTRLRGNAPGLTRVDYGTHLRDGAAVLTLVSESRVLEPEAPKLATVVAAAFARKSYTSTQEQAWMLLAARAVADQARDMRLTVNGTEHAGELQRTLTAASLGAGGLEITNRGDAAVDAVVSVIGAALTPEPAISKGFMIERELFTLDGKPVSARNGLTTLRQNDRLVAVVRITGSEEGGRILVVDRLPAGLEVENPRLVAGGDTKAFSWLKTEGTPQHKEFRDDRFVAAFDFFGRGTAKSAIPSASVAYIVRAVTPGTYVHPAATVEDMYAPERYARTDAGKLVVERAE